MMVVAILSLLVAIAIPQFVKFSAKSKRSEGILLLQGIFKAEISYYSTEDVFCDDHTKLGVYEDLMKAKVYYEYGPASVISRDAGKQAFRAWIGGNIDSDEEFIDALCIIYPVDFNGCTVPAPVGEVFVLLDDLTNRTTF